MAEVVRASPAIAGRRERLRKLPAEAGYYERIALGEMVAAEVDRRRDADAALVLDRLEPLAVSTRTEPSAGPDSAFNVAFLVERDRMTAFGKAVAKLGEELGDRVVLRFIGPLPPYSFVDAELTAGSGGWA
jgi:hypothetical protein